MKTIISDKPTYENSVETRKYLHRLTLMLQKEVMSLALLELSFAQKKQMTYAMQRLCSLKTEVQSNGLQY